MSESSDKSIELKKFEDLDFTDDFMFCRVLEYHPEICRELAELITGRKVTKIVSVIILLRRSLGTALRRKSMLLFRKRAKMKNGGMIICF